MPTWIALITSLPTENATARMRAWRSLKASGAAVLRDGVYLMPEREDCRNTLDAVATDVRDADGTALVVRLEEPSDGNFVALFDRSADYCQSAGRHHGCPRRTQSGYGERRVEAGAEAAQGLRQPVRYRLLPRRSQKQADEALRDLEQRAAWALSPDEPHPINDSHCRLSISDYLGRIWATRRRPWVDRLASAWLIRRFIDPQAKLLWLASPADCPADALASTSMAQLSPMSAPG
jgi:hypothetical protein